MRFDALEFRNVGRHIKTNYIDMRPLGFYDSHRVHENLLKFNIMYNPGCGDGYMSLSELLYHFSRYAVMNVNNRISWYHNPTFTDSEFTLYFTVNNMQYKYYLNMNIGRDCRNVVNSESLCIVEGERTRDLFAYDNREYHVYCFNEADTERMTDILRNCLDCNRTLLSTLYFSFKLHPDLSPVFEFFDSVILYAPTDYIGHDHYILEMLETTDGIKLLSEWAHIIDNSVDRITPHVNGKPAYNGTKSPLDKITVLSTKYVVYHGEYIESNRNVIRELNDTSESFKTALRLFAFIYVHRGKTLVIDSLSTISANIARMLLILADVTNTQVIASITNTDLVKMKYFRRDEINVIDSVCGVNSIQAIPDFNFDMNWSVEFEDFSEHLLKGTFGGVLPFDGFSELRSRLTESSD